MIDNATDKMCKALSDANMDPNVELTITPKKNGENFSIHFCGYYSKGNTGS